MRWVLCHTWFGMCVCRGIGGGGEGYVGIEVMIMVMIETLVMGWAVLSIALLCGGTWCTISPFGCCLFILMLHVHAVCVSPFTPSPSVPIHTVAMSRPLHKQYSTGMPTNGAQHAAPVWWLRTSNRGPRFYWGP